MGMEILDGILLVFLAKVGVEDIPCAARRDGSGARSRSSLFVGERERESKNN